MIFDVAIIGGGAIGVATALQLTRLKPGISLLLVESSDRLANHQTGNNSGVIHSGLYYRPGSLKAENCVMGRKMLFEYCDENQIPVEKCGKLVVAVERDEISRLDALFERGVQNGLLGLKKVPREQIPDYEPYVTGVQAIWVPETGIVDYVKVVESMGTNVQKSSGIIHLNTTFLGQTESQGILHLETTRNTYKAHRLVNCGGLYSDRIARLCGIHPNLKIIPFRGEYYKLRSEKNHLVNNLIYPVPDPQFPFLGAHFTRMIDGIREAGPNAVLAFKREGYRKDAVSFNDMLDYLSYPGFWTMSRKHWKMGFGEMYRSCFKPAFLRALQKLIPSIQSEDITPGGAGVRAQALESDGSLVDDFRIIQTSNMVHVLNAPSPAATACLSIGRTIGEIILGLR